MRAIKDNRTCSISGNNQSMIIADGEVVRSDHCDGRDVGDVKILSPDSPDEKLVRSIVSEMMNRGLDDGEEWDKIQSPAWCRTELGLGNVLLRKLRAWETCREYSQDYFVLDNSGYDDFLLLKDLAGFRAGAFINWAQNVGLDYNDICAVSGITTFTQHEKPEPPKKRAPQKSLTIVPAQKRMAVPQVPNLARTCPQKFHKGNIARLLDDRETSEGVPNSVIIKDVVHRIVVAILDRVSVGQAPARRAVENAMSTSWCMEALGIMSPLIRHCITPIGADAYVYECIDREKYPTYYICRFLTQLRVRGLLSWAREAGIKADELADAATTSQSDGTQDGEIEPARAVGMSDRCSDVEDTLKETIVHPKPLSEIRREIAASKMAAAFSGNKVSSLTDGDDCKGETIVEQHATAEICGQSKFAYDNETVEKMGILLGAEFKNGVRIGSVIDRNRVKRAWAERFGDPPEEIDWDALLSQSGLQYENKVFPRVDQAALLQFVQSLVVVAHGIFCSTTLFEKEAETLVRMGIQSEALLRFVLAIRSSHKYFTIDGSIRPVRLDEALMAAFAEKERWTRDDLKVRFPYVPAEKIWQTLLQDKRFACVGDCTYTLFSSIQLDRDECNKNAREMMVHIADEGFYSLKQCAFPHSLELNGDVDPSAVYAAFFRDYLALNYDKHGVIICRKGEQVGSLEVVRAFCRSRDEATPDEVLSVAHELGVTGTSRFLEVAHEEMVRVEDGRFVSSKLVSFDIAGCDAALDELMPACGVMPLCGVRSFVAFPAVPIFSWNVFLLESYLRRESHRYQYMQNFRTTRPQGAVGAIVRRGIGIESFEDALARAVVAAKIQTTEEAVGDFLLHEQYIRRRREIEKTVAELARKMAAREEEYD